MGKTLDEMLLGAESQERAKQAVNDAVASADAAGLVPAFEPYVSLSKHLPKEELLTLRRQARASKATKDQENLEFHRRVVELLFAGGEVNKAMKAQALEMVQKWEDRKVCGSRYIFTWRQWLDMPQEFAKRAILDETDLGLSMRCNSPFFLLKELKGRVSK